MFTRCKAKINVQAFLHNINVIKDAVPHSKIIIPVKANAYGHGIANVVRAIKADMFAVASITEAFEVRVYDQYTPILLLEGVHCPEDYVYAQALNCCYTIHSEYQLLWLEAQTLIQPVDVFIKVNTGMNRLGFDVSIINQVLERIKTNKNIRVYELITHFAMADEPISDSFKEQNKLCQLLVDQHKKVSLANSSYVLSFYQPKPIKQDDSGFNALLHGQYVRPGIATYGVDPFFSFHYLNSENKNIYQSPLKLAMHLSAKVIAINKIKRNDAVGYGATWKASKATTLAVVSIGYGDGYPRKVQAAHVAINGKRYPVVGVVSMDMMTVDLGIDGEAEYLGYHKVHVGDDVEIWGDHIRIEEVAVWSDTIAYELLCRVTGRVAREIIHYDV